VDELLAKKKFTSQLESFEERARRLRDFIGALRPDLQVDIEVCREFLSAFLRMHQNISFPLPALTYMRFFQLLRFESIPFPVTFFSNQPLHDMFGPSTARGDLQALVVSEETLSGGHLVNTRRVELGHQPCAVVVVPLVASDPRYVWVRHFILMD
jgi:phosphopantetheine adenylyltransferase